MMTLAKAGAAAIIITTIVNTKSMRLNALPPLTLCAPPRTGSLFGIPKDPIGYFGDREEFFTVVRFEATV